MPIDGADGIVTGGGGVATSDDPLYKSKLRCGIVPIVIGISSRKLMAKARRWASN